MTKSTFQQLVEDALRLSRARRLVSGDDPLGHSSTRRHLAEIIVEQTWNKVAREARNGSY